METLRQKLERIEVLNPKHIEKAPGSRFLQGVTERGSDVFREAAQPRMLDDKVAGPAHAAQPQVEAVATRTPSDMRAMPGQKQPDPTMVPPGMSGAIRNGYDQWATKWRADNAETNKILGELEQAAPSRSKLTEENVRMLRDLTKDRGRED